MSLLFAYGTLRPGCRHGYSAAQATGAQLDAACDWIGPARIRGRLYQIGWYPALVIDPSAGWVMGELCRLHAPAEQLMMLDTYEEMDAPDPEYTRELQSVDAAHGNVQAWAYCYARPVMNLPRIISGDFALLDRRD